ncbi:glycosyltransferase [Nocardioides sp. GY 10113]|uniref:glycosyltransferase n=1 Tax=Nocardioides sp. GY 10113 TaxID=2569761 RepID=UPI0026CB288F
MSMSVAPFVPHDIDLMVGTARIRETVVPVRGERVHLLEPPVDTDRNAPGAAPGAFLVNHGAAPDAVQVVIVSRLVPELKLEGILTAIAAVGGLARTGLPVHLTIVGGGTAGDVVASSAAAANSGLPRPAVTLTGEVADPREAYDQADICIGMGGSALRALSFGKPLVVQGEGGFFELLDHRSVPLFLDQGFYGVAQRSSAEAVTHLADGILRPLVNDLGARRELGSLGRQLVLDRFSLDAAAAAQEAVYLNALERRTGRPGEFPHAARSAAGLLDYKIRRRLEHWRGRAARDDFNARPA